VVLRVPLCRPDISAKHSISYHAYDLGAQQDSADLIGKAHQRGWACSDYSSDATEYREVGHFVRFRARTGQASFNALALKA